MKNFLKIIPISFVLLCALPLTSCGENMDDYVGTWRAGVSYEETYKYYWGSKKSLGTNSVSGLPVNSVIVISKNKKVNFYYPNSDSSIEGRIGFVFGKVVFRGLNFSDSYKFELTENSDGKKCLDHVWSEDKHGFDYEEKHRRISFIIET